MLTNEISTPVNNITPFISLFPYFRITNHSKPLPSNTKLGGGLFADIPNVAVVIWNGASLLAVIDCSTANMDTKAQVYVIP